MGGRVRVGVGVMLRVGVRVMLRVGVGLLTGLKYLVESRLEDLERHPEGHGAAPATLAQVTEGGVAHHGRQRRVVGLTAA
ncbi:hypothetical protein EYF80_013722 [Liparis tanakae]|uniref:Uncharacterized protein n=1 Tax=Liparis tanakae TaxID=230148 RepID=A0A4Z2ID06_9TELE|nr:hypothetical protein EYF80_013722 [Liparis tanakae]